MMGSASALRRQTFTPAASASGIGVPAAMGGTISASVNVGGGGDGNGALLVLTGGVVALILFYLWTHSIQGGP